MILLRPYFTNHVRLVFQLHMLDVVRLRRYARINARRTGENMSHYFMSQNIAIFFIFYQDVCDTVRSHNAFFCLFFLVVVCVCTRSRWHIGYTKKEHVHKTNKNRELGFWFKPLKFKHFLQHINCEDPDPRTPVAQWGGSRILHMSGRRCASQRSSRRSLPCGSMPVTAWQSASGRLGWKMEVEQPMDHLVSGRLMRWLRCISNNMILRLGPSMEICPQTTTWTGNLMIHQWMELVLLVFLENHQSWGCMGNGGSTTPKVGSDRTHIGCWTKQKEVLNQENRSLVNQSGGFCSSSLSWLGDPNFFIRKSSKSANEKRVQSHCHLPQNQSSWVVLPPMASVFTQEYWATLCGLSSSYQMYLYVGYIESP